MKLRARQEEFVEKCVAALRGRGNTLGVAPTGSGKTVMLSAVDRAVRSDDRKMRTVILQHRDELVNQNRRTYEAINPGVSTSAYNAKHKDWSGSTVFAMVQTLARPEHLERMPPIDALVIDEAHHSAAASYHRLIDTARLRNPDMLLFGVTATPNRGDKRALRHLFDNVADQITLKELIEAGHLVRPRTFLLDLPGVGDELKRVKKIGDEFDMDAVAAILDKEPLNNEIVRHWREHAGDRPTVVFCATVAHAQHVCAAFVESGVRAGVVSGDMPSAERQAVLAAYDRGELQLLCNVAVLTEGWDCLDYETEILTPNGWMRRDQIAVGDLVMAYDTNTGAIVPTRADDVGDRPARPRENMVRWSSQHLDIRVTEKHRMFASFGPRRCNSATQFVEAGKIADAGRIYTLPLAAVSWGQFPGIDFTDDEIRLAAWSFTDSYIDKRNRILLYQMKADGIAHIRALLTRLQIKFSEAARDNPANTYESKTPCVTFELRDVSPSLLKYCRNGGLHMVKRHARLPEAWKDVTREQLLVFWTELLKGDGHAQGKKSGWLWTPCKGFADDLMALAIMRGLSASVAAEKTPAGKDFYRVSMRDANRITSDPRDPRATRIKASPAETNERVWCVTNRFGTLIARRNGKAVVLGNCQPISCVVLLRPSSFKSTMIQMIGRGLRKVDPERYPGVRKDDCVVLDFGASIRLHGGIEQEIALAGEGLKICPPGDAGGCGASVPVQCRDCPLCGFEFPPIGEAPTKVCPECGQENHTAVRLCIGCGYEFEREEREAISEFVLTEVDLFADSPYRWTEMFQGLALVATAFEASAFVVAYAGRWWAFGRDGSGDTRSLGDSDQRVTVLASADDFLREHGSKAANKTKGWLYAPPTEKQLGMLRLPPEAALQMTRYEAACMIEWRKRERVIRTRLEHAIAAGQRRAA